LLLPKAYRRADPVAKTPIRLKTTPCVPNKMLERQQRSAPQKTACHADQIAVDGGASANGGSAGYCGASVMVQVGPIPYLLHANHEAEAPNGPNAPQSALFCLRGCNFRMRHRPVGPERRARSHICRAPPASPKPAPSCGHV